MYTFLIGIAILIVGYLTWGKLAEKIFAPDKRLTPALAEPDTYERVPLSRKRNLLLQLLNIAGLGPILGAVLGILFGPIVFILLPIGNIIGGTVHDYFVGMISMRNHGNDLMQLIAKFLGGKLSWVFTIFFAAGLLMLVANYIVIPASIISELLPYGIGIFIAVIVLILAYNIISSLFPIDKIIGKIYPYIGAFALIPTLMLGVVVFSFHAGEIPDVSLTVDGFLNAFTIHPQGQSILPMLLITISCGILSGFHATQSPIISRTVTSEHDGRKIFYGMMVLEGVIAMVWAAAASVFFTANPDAAAAGMSGNEIVYYSMVHLLPPFLITIPITAPLLLAVTSGDTALRVLRTSTASLLNKEQKTPRQRIIFLLPFVGIVTALIVWAVVSSNGFLILWNYFSWINQIIACFALLMITVYLASKTKKAWLISAVPAAGIIFICVSYILWVSPAHLTGAPVGFGLPLELSYIAGVVFAALLPVLAVFHGKKLSKREDFSADEPAVYPADNTKE